MTKRLFWVLKGSPEFPECKKCNKDLVPLTDLHDMEVQPYMELFECPKCQMGFVRMAKLKGDK